MKNVVISEWPIEATKDFVLDLCDHQIKDCLGCWSCWIKTPGRCIQSDLDEFYQAFFKQNRQSFILSQYWIL